MGAGSRGSILIVDDDALFRAALARELQSKGYDATAVADPEAAVERLELGSFDLLLTDLKMPGADGIALIERARAIDPDLVSIVITGFGSAERSIDALDRGAFWFIDKSYDRIACFSPLVQKALEFRRLKSSNSQLQRQLEVRYGLDSIVGESDGLRATLDLVRKVADTDATVLILGESGVGKELVARATHFNSRRAAHPFVAVNCGAIPEELLASELFGHVRGAFTGAVREREGRFSAAQGGTLFLDEIGDMSATLQTKLLRVLQEREYEPVGSSRTVQTDVRIIAATNQDLAELIASKRFREDLFFRLSVVPIEVPPLRERRDDIPMLVDYFLAARQRDYPELKGITAVALKRLCDYDWPGNVRELQGMVERLAILRRSGWIDEDDLPESLRAARPARPSISLPPGGVDFDALVDDFEADLIGQALQATGWNKNQASRLLGLKRTTLVEKIRAKGLTPPPGTPPVRRGAPKRNPSTDS